MEKVTEDKEREERITMEAIVDCYDSQEQAMGWYYYLDDKIHFPFQAQCTKERSTSPLNIGETVAVTGMADTDDCLCEMFVTIKWSERALSVPLTQLTPTDADEEIEEAISDWHYWIGRGYRLC